MLFIYIWIIFFRASVRRITSFISIIVVETDAIDIKVGHRIDTLKWYTDGYINTNYILLNCDKKIGYSNLFKIKNIDI